MINNFRDYYIKWTLRYQFSFLPLNFVQMQSSIGSKMSSFTEFSPMASGERFWTKRSLIINWNVESLFYHQPRVKLIGGSGISICCQPEINRRKPLIRRSQTPICRSDSVPVQLWLVEPMMLENDALAVTACEEALSLKPARWWSFCSASYISELK